MHVDFRQGIITYPRIGQNQTFLQYNGGYVSLSCANSRTDIAFAHATSNYLLSETVDVHNAWGPLNAGVSYWLYWDIDLRTAARTFGMTTVQPVVSPLQPTAVEDQHWFNTDSNTMYVATSGSYRPVVRVFAAKITDGSFVSLGSDAIAPYAGSQVGVNHSVKAGRILLDDAAAPIRRSDGTFFTTETQMFVDGASVNATLLEGAIVTVTSTSAIPKYHVVRLTEFGKIGSATYNDVSNSTIGLLLEDLTVNQVGTVVLQGYVTNPDWNWASLTNLWVGVAGELVELDPHLQNPLTYPTKKPPVARVVSPTSIFFDQGLGGIGERGPSGEPLRIASTTASGVARLNIDPLDSQDPVVVGANDVRLTDARNPLYHTQSADTILHDPYGSLSGATLQETLAIIEDGKLAVAGGAMTGWLTLSADPILASHAVTKRYVDTTAFQPAPHTHAATSVTTSSYGSLNGANLQLVVQQIEDGKVAKTGSTMTGPLVLSGSPTAALHAATKAYADTKLSLNGGTISGPLVIATPTADLHAATKLYVDTKLTKQWVVITSSPQPTVSEGAYMCDTTNGSFSVVLPPNPSANSTISIADYAGTFNTHSLTIVRNGRNIMGLAENMVISTKNISITLVYVNTTQGWRIV